MKNNSIIVAFHIGRGGRFNNAGHKSFSPYVSKLQDCFGDNSFIIDEDENGNTLPDSEWRLLDGGSNTILEGREAIESETGCLEWDTIYDTDIVKYIEDCTEEEIDILYKAYTDDEYMSSELKDAVCELKGMKRVSSVKVYNSNMTVFYQDGSLELQRDNYSECDEDEVREELEDMDFTPESIDTIIDKMETAEWIEY